MVSIIASGINYYSFLDCGQCGVACSERVPLMQLGWFCNNNVAADRAKQIKTKAIVNEDPTEALIRELKEENERLKARMKSGDVDEQELKDMAGKEVMTKEELAAMKKAWLEEMKANMKTNEKARKSLQIKYGGLRIEGQTIRMLVSS